MATKAHLEGNARHIAKLDSMLLRPYKAEGAEIRAAAAAAGQSVQAYILEAVRQRMQRDRQAQQLDSKEICNAMKR